MDSIAQKIRATASSLRDETAKILSHVIRVPALSSKEADRISLLKSMCETAGFDEVRIDGLGNLLARVGSGKKILAVDAHIDTVDTGDPAQWKNPPFSGLVSDGLVHGRGASDQLGGAASMIAAGRILKTLGYSGGCTVWFSFTIMEEDCDGLCWKYLI
ncbi:MAG TPA: M20/M25/M40 family metallo-hydrolase, partial [Magnetospirillaceae bacterium]|nr:M20/M25/M40 family metallo-hydrolase [Magnetospirillaceae bacterium]